ADAPAWRADPGPDAVRDPFQIGGNGADPFGPDARCRGDTGPRRSLDSGLLGHLADESSRLWSRGAPQADAGDLRRGIQRLDHLASGFAMRTSRGGHGEGNAIPRRGDV